MSRVVFGVVIGVDSHLNSVPVFTLVRAMPAALTPGTLLPSPGGYLVAVELFLGHAHCIGSLTGAC